MRDRDVRVDAVVGNEQELFLGRLQVNLAHESRERKAVDQGGLVLVLDRAAKGHHRELEGHVQVLGPTLRVLLHLCDQPVPGVCFAPQLCNGPRRK